MNEKKYGKPLNVDVPQDLHDAFLGLSERLGWPKKRLASTALRLLLELKPEVLFKEYNKTCEQYYATESKGKTPKGR